MQKIFAKFWSSVRRLVTLSAITMTIVALITFECMARLDDWVHFGAPLAGNYDFEQLFHETERGVRGIPHGRYLRWHLNSDGLHGPEVERHAGDSLGVVFGASEVFGIYEDEGRDLSREIEKRLNTISSGHLVLNAGIPGLRIGAGVSLLAELRSKYQPTWIAIYPTPTHYIGVSTPYCTRPAKEPAPRRFTPTLRIVDKARELTKQHVPRPLLSLARRASIAWRMWNRVPLERMPEISLQAFEADLKCAISGTRSLEATPMVLTHANRFEGASSPDAEYWLVGWRNQYPEMSEAGFLDLERRANDIIRRVADEEKVQMFDAANAMSGHPEWFADHAHFSNAGAAALAQKLATGIILHDSHARPAKTGQ